MRQASKIVLEHTHKYHYSLVHQWLYAHWWYLWCIKNYTTQEIINEMKGVLQRPRITKRISLVEQEFIITAFEKFSEKILSGVKFEEIKDDPADNKFLECAVSASADYIISGDNHLLNLKEFRGIKIVRPSEFIKLMTL